MPITKAQQKATAKYQKANYDDIKVRVSKGKREIIKNYAESKGKSLNEYINELIEKDMSQNQEESCHAPEEEQIKSNAEKIIIEKANEVLEETKDQEKYKQFLEESGYFYI